MKFLFGIAVGYVLGSRAGRERYEDIVAMARRVAGSQTVQATAGVLQAQAAGRPSGPRAGSAAGCWPVSGPAQPASTATGTDACRPAQPGSDCSGASEATRSR